MADKSLPETDRALTWERVKKAAQEHHRHPKDHGINKIIGDDADRSSQTVGDWKYGRAPIPVAVLAKLAALYGRSTGYLAGYTDDPTPATPADKAALRAKMVALVEDVVTQLNPNADPKLVIAMCDMALDMLQEGKPEETILGTLYKKMRESDSISSGKSAITSQPGRAQ